MPALRELIAPASGDLTQLEFLDRATRILFFTGKGGVGKISGRPPEDLRRAGIEQYGWVINQSFAGNGYHDRVLAFGEAR